MIRKKRIWDFYKILFISAYFNCSLCHANHCGLFFLFRRSSIWVLPFAVAISMCEDVVSAAVFGSLSGLLCDLGSQALFGFNGLLVLCGCVAISLLSFFLIKVNWKSALLLGGALAAIRALLEFFFFYLFGDMRTFSCFYPFCITNIHLYHCFNPSSFAFDSKNQRKV